MTRRMPQWVPGDPPWMRPDLDETGLGAVDGSDDARDGRPMRPESGGSDAWAVAYRRAYRDGQRSRGWWES